VVICLERGADLHMVQLMPLPLTVSCFSKTQIGYTFLVPAQPGSPGQRAVNVCVYCTVYSADFLSRILLQIFGAPYAPEVAETLPGIYNFLIDCTETASDSAESFPQQYAPWKDGCHLHSPLSGKLTQPESGENVVIFRLGVPRAVGVAVVIGSVGAEWVMLKKRKDDIWESEVDLAKVWGTGSRVAVCAAYEGAADTYSTLLEYST